MSARLLPALRHSMGGTLRAFWRAARQLFHEAIGAFFAVFAAYGVLAAWRQWHRQPVWWVIVFAIVYAVMMSVFSFASFRRARRIR